MIYFLCTSTVLLICRYLKKYLADFSQTQNGLQMKSFHIYTTVQSKMADICRYLKISKHKNDYSEDSVNEFGTPLCQNNPQEKLI